MREISTQALRAFKDENAGAIEVVKSSMQGPLRRLGANSRRISRRVRSAISVGISYSRIRNLFRLQKRALPENRP
jgi:hypothetical protein